ncbi:MAG: PAS domain S-box protein, partial [Bacteroidota bacterium]
MKLTRDLAFRVWIPFVLVSLVASALFSWFFSRNQSAVYHRQQLRELNVVADGVSAAAKVLLMEKDVPALEHLLKASSGNVGISAAIVVRHQKGVPEMVSSNDPVFDVELMHDSLKWFSVIKPVFSNGESEWSVMVGIPQQRIKDQLFKLNFPVYLALVISVALSCILFYLMSLQFSEPVVETTRFTEKLLKGDFSGHLSGTHGIAEIGRLNDSLNNLKVTLARQRTRNKELTAGLEFQVSKRTLELKMVLQRLNAAQEMARLANFTYWPGNDVWEMSPNINEIMSADCDRISTMDEFLASVSTDGRAEAEKTIRTAIAATDRIHLDFQLDPAIRPGTWWFSLIAEFKRDANSGLPYIAGTIQDITDRKEFEAQIDRLALVARLTSNGVIITDASKNITWVNEGMERITGYRLEEMIGQSPKMFQSANTSQGVRQVIREHLDRMKPIRVELENVTKSGNPYWIELHIEPIPGPYGKIGGFLAIQVDITERKRYEENLRHALSRETELNQMKSRFISMTSHEFRTPLTSIQSSTELLEMLFAGEQGPTKQRSYRYLSRIKSEVFRMTALMDDILLLGRVEAGRVMFRVAETDLPALLNEVFHDRRILYNDDRNIVVEQLGTPRPVRIDPVL